MRLLKIVTAASCDLATIEQVDIVAAAMISGRILFEVRRYLVIEGGIAVPPLVIVSGGSFRSSQQFGGLGACQQSLSRAAVHASMAVPEA